jgi:hypothetical protein
MPEQQIHMLQQQICHHQDEIHTLQMQLSQEFNVGFTHGHSHGFKEAMSMLLGHRPSANPGNPPVHERREPHEPRNRCKDRECCMMRDPHNLDEREAKDLWHAIGESCHDARPARPVETPGAGPSHDPSCSAPCPAVSSRLQAPVTPTTDADPYHNYEVNVIQKNGIDVPDPKKVKLEGFACIPLLAEYSMPCLGIAIMHGPATPPNPEDTTSYMELWAGFTTGHMVPDPFRCLFQAIGLVFLPSDARSTMLRYGLVWQIARANVGIFNQNAIGAFLVTLAAFEQAIGLSSGRDSLWGRILDHEPS